MTSTTSHLAADAISAAGIDTLFCLPGVQNDDFFNVLVDRPEIRIVHTRHEQGCSYMALGASQVTGKPSACCVVPGPGMLNAAAGLNSAYWASGRILAIIGAIASTAKGKGYGMLHELPDQTAILGQLGKRVEYLDTPASATTQVQAALDDLVSGRPQPVSLEVPVDLWTAEVSGGLQAPVASTPDVDTDRVEQIARLLGNAERPLIVSGAGAWDASPEVTALAEMLQAPVFTRRGGHGVLDARHSLWAPLGVGHELWAEADVVLGIGTRMEWPLSQWGTDDNLTVIQLNIDEAELDRWNVGAVGLHADAAEGCRALLDAVPQHNRTRPSRTDEMNERRARFNERIAHLQPQLDYLGGLRDVLPDDGVVVEDVTQMGFAAHFAFEFRQPRTFLTSGAAGTLGAGTAQAIGAQAAAPNRPVVVLAGDGGFLFTATELATAVQHNIPVNVVVFDNAAYGNVKGIQTNRFGADRTIASDLVNPDFVAFAESFGVAAERVDSPAAFRPAMERSIAHNGPSLISVDIGETPSPWPFLLMGPARG